MCSEPVTNNLKYLPNWEPILYFEFGLQPYIIALLIFVFLPENILVAKKKTLYIKMSKINNVDH